MPTRTALKRYLDAKRIVIAAGMKEREYLNARQLVNDMAKIAYAFLDEEGRTLQEIRKVTDFVDSNGIAVHPGDPEYEEICQRHEAELVLETAHIVDVMQNTRLSVWCAALRIAAEREDIRLLPRLRQDNDRDSDVPGEL
jgi:hypothetical protein